MSSNNGGRKVVKKIVEVIKTNESKKVKCKYRFKNKLIIFTYYLKLFFTLNYIIKLFYQTWCVIKKLYFKTYNIYTTD